MAIVLANGDGKPPDWQDFVGIVVLLVINSTISFIEENNAGNAAAALMANLAPKTKVLSVWIMSVALLCTVPELSLLSRNVRALVFPVSRCSEMGDGANRMLQFLFLVTSSASNSVTSSPLMPVFSRVTR